MDPAAISPVNLSSQKNLWLVFGRVFQIAVICLTVGLFVASLPLSYEKRLVVCQAADCPPGVLGSASLQALDKAGLSLETFVSMTLGLDIFIALVYTTSAVIIFVRKPNDVLTIFVTVMLVTFGAGTFTSELSGITSVYPQLRWLTKTIELIGNCSIIAFLLIFPSGRFTPRWSMIILAGWFLFQLPRYYFPDSGLNLLIAQPLLYQIIFFIGALSALAVQIFRYLQLSDSIARQQTKWVVYGITIGVGGYLAVRSVSLFLADPLGSDLLISLVLAIISIFSMCLLPLSVSIAVMRYRLWDINPIINRTLVYGALSALTIGVYILAVGYFSSLFQNNTANWIISFIATGVVAVLFEPLRERLQRLVNRLMYGDRNDPATVLTNLSRRLDSALAPASFLQTIVETLAQTLRLPYSAIVLYALDEEPRVISSLGLPPPEVVHFPLIYQGESVGELILAPRAQGEVFSPADLTLIQLITQQAGAVAYTVRLNNDLQTSRERLVSAREEERRRLRRDLHDGVGPTLASLAQRIDTAADLVSSDPQASIKMLHELKGQVRSTIAEIRRLVYALRPPVLDEFGLVSAVREHIAQYTGPNGMRVTYDLTDPMPPLPAAVEVAAYRIVLEAFTNIVNHAGASDCHIKMLVRDNRLLLEISDNGRGLPADAPIGVGLTSMRERSNELGGEFFCGNVPTGGTRIKASLPIASEQPSG